jgi:glutaredoxin-related protein
MISDTRNETIRYALVTVLENGNVRQLSRPYKDWNKAAQHGEKLVTAKRIKGFRIVLK